MRLQTFRLLVLATVLFFDAGAAERDAKHVYTAVLTEPPVAARLTPTDKGGDLRKLAAPVLAAQGLVRARFAASDIEVIGATQHVLNAVFIRATVDEARQVATTPGVSRVFRARRFQTWATDNRYGPRANAAGDVIRALEARQALGGTRPGRGGHPHRRHRLRHRPHPPAFQDNGLQFPPGFPKGRPEDLAFTNNKIIAARSYAHLLSPLDANSSRPDDFSPRDRTGHGTAVAMIAAGRPVTSPIGAFSGVAPKAFLANYKIFGSPDLNEITSDAAILAAMDDAVVDGMDILTVSFGAIAQFPWDASSATPRAFLRPGRRRPRKTSSRALASLSLPRRATPAPSASRASRPRTPSRRPARLPAVITVGATVNARRLLQSVEFGGRAVDALSGTGPELSATLQARGVDAFDLGDSAACAPLPAGSLAGKIVVIDRGGCEPEFKVEFADRSRRGRRWC